ncbi:MAG TPA: methylmalonyl-CoA epimerase [Planctomycetota bacterium]
MGLRGIDHIAIAVEDLDAATAFWRDVLGLREGAREQVESQGVTVQMMHAGDTRVELLHPSGPDTPVGRHLARRGPGLHHLALAVDDCALALERAGAAGVRRINEEPLPGAHGTRVAFLHPSGTGGVLTELVAGGE